MVISLSPEELERAALSAMLTPETMQAALDVGIDDFSFQVDTHVKAFDYLKKSAAAGRSVTSGDVKTICGVVLSGDVTDTVTLFTLLGDLSRRRRAKRSMWDAVDQLDKGKTDEAISSLIGDLADLITRNAAHQSAFDSGASERLLRLIDRAEARARGETFGISTGLTIFDANYDTFKPGEVIAIQGATNAGKSFLMLKICAHAYMKEQRRVLFLSPESTVDDIELRLDPIIARYLGFRLSNRALRNAEFDPGVYAQYIGAVAELGRNDWITRDSGSSGVFTMDDIVSLAREHRPDILAIDGFHLIRGDGKSWEAMKYAAETIKGVAQNMGIVVIATTQAQRSASLANDDAPSTGQAAYGMALNEAANRVISIAQWTGKKNGRIFTVPKFRDGEVVTRRQYLHFDVDSGHIEQTMPEIDLEGDIDFR